MGQQQIREKLKSHLERHMPPTEECHVLYLMAEARKFLDQNQVQEGKYSPVRFYANWCVHKIVRESRAFANEASANIISYIENSFLTNRQIIKGDYLAQFLSLELLKHSLEMFLKDNNLPIELTHGAYWEAFRERLFGILSEQSFKEPAQNPKFVLVYEESGNGYIEIDALTGNQGDSIPFHQKDLT